MTTFSSILEAAGLLAVIAAAFLFDPRLGLAAAGVVAVLVGLALDPPRRER